MKTCRFCAEEIPDDSTLCPYCGRHVGSLPQTPSTPPQGDEAKRTQTSITHQRSRGARRYGLIPIGIVFICAAIIAIPEIVAFSNLRAGIAAFNAGNCPEAMTKFANVMENAGWSSARRLRAERLALECTSFLLAVKEEEANRFGLALAYYIDFQRIYPDSSLTNHVPSRVASLFGKATVKELAVGNVCDRVALLGESELLPRPYDQLPEFYYYCGNTFESSEEYENAILMYTAFRANYPRHQLFGLATEGLARAEIEFARQGGTGTIIQPQESGTTSAGTSVYEVQNDSPERLQIILSGPETIIEEISACATCTEYTREPAGCPNKGPIKRLTLAPGKYNVLVKAITDEYIKPYEGSWTFRDGTEYSECYYVLTTTQP